MKIGDTVELGKIQGTIVHIKGDVCTVAYAPLSEVSCNIKYLTLVKSK